MAILNADQPSREEMLQVLEFYYLSKNYSESFLKNMSDDELKAEYERYVNSGENK